MSTKDNYIKYLLFCFFLVLLIGCESKEEATNPKENTSVQIVSISPKDFKYGDTITITGKNFGAKKGTSYVEFTGIKEDKILWLIENNDEVRKEADGYVSWSDTLIKVVAPQNAVTGKLYINHRDSNGYNYKINRPTYVNIIDSTVKISLLISVIFIYLKINKIWKRKHELEVADSQSLTGLGIYIANCILWVSYYIFVANDPKSMLDTIIYIFEGTIFFVIGTGIFVKGQRGQRFWKLIMRSLRLERKEADYLIKRFFRPVNAEVIINILHQLAMIDNELAPKEQELLETFSKEWNIDYSPEKLNKNRSKDTSNNYMKLRKTVTEYLNSEPPIEQVAQLKDMMNAMINADDKVSDEEELIFSELGGILEAFLQSEKNIPMHHVLIVPQKDEQIDTIRELLPDANLLNISGGLAYSIGSYHSTKYAEMICKEYQQIKLFTFVYESTKPETESDKK